MRIIQNLCLLIISHLLLYHPIFASPEITDTLRIIGIRVEFQEDDSPNTTGNGKFDLSDPFGPFQIDPPPHDRSYFQDHLTYLMNYFGKVSGGQLYLNGEIFPVPQQEAYQLSEQMTSYNPNRTPSENDVALAQLFRDAINAADADPAVNFGQFQSVIIFHAGVGKDVDIGFDETPQDIPSLFITSGFLQKNLGIPGIEVDNGQTIISEGIIAPESESQGGIELGLNGILTSNFGSQLGWLDLFSPETRRTGIGRFGLMDTGLFNGEGLLPALPCAWTRIEAGWEQPENVYYAANYVLSISYPLSGSPVKMYRIPINQSEYFLVENRYAGTLNFDSLQFVMAQDRSDFPNAKEVLLTHFADQLTFSSRGVLIDIDNPDIGLPGSGCLIWHIDEKIIAQNRITNRINADPERRGVALEEADGSEDIGQAYNLLSAGFGSELGWVLDMWYDGNNSPIFKNEFSPSSTPNSRSYERRANSHIKMFDFSTPDSVMTFRVEFNIFQQNFPRFIDNAQYGIVRSMKTSDLDFDGGEEMIMTTDQGFVLVVNDDGYSQWGSDSFMIAEFEQNLIHPIVFFNDPLNVGIKSKGMVILTENGQVYGFSFTPSHSLDTLFRPIQTSGLITTHAVATYNPDSTINVLWGNENGRIYNLAISNTEVSLDSLESIQEPIQYLHVNGGGQIIMISGSGKVYRYTDFIKDTELTYFSPVGNVAVGLTRDGKFLNFEDQNETYPEDGIFRFDSPMITHPFLDEKSALTRYFVVGDNRLYSYNINFTLSENFPVKVNLPNVEKELPLTPLFNKFFNSGLNTDFGVIVTDPSGLIDGFDLNGKRLRDFPLALGDSIDVEPVLLDIDRDGDLEISCITRQGNLYVWDLASNFERYGWNQLYYNELNSNRNNNPLQGGPGGSSQDSFPNQLLPENKVYNWPNPNINDYTFIRYFLTQQANVSIKIFDIAGDLVEELPAKTDTQTANEVRWNLQDVQSGVYLARIEAKNSTRQEVRIIKIAVVK
jgi:M6 family metalloprotease-like protein